MSNPTRYVAQLVYDYSVVTITLEATRLEYAEEEAEAKLVKLGLDDPNDIIILEA